MAAFALFGAAIGATAYLAVQEIDEKPEAVGVPSLPPEISAVRAMAEPRDETVAPMALEAAEQPAEAPIVESVPALEPSQATPLLQRRTPRKVPTAHHPVKGAIKPSAAAPASASQTAATNPDSQPAQQSKPPVLASAALAPAPSVRDRWEGMNTALAACSNENFLAGVVCTERVRLEYCEGFWGQVPQCRAAARPGTVR